MKPSIFYEQGTILLNALEWKDAEDAINCLVTVLEK
jgi:hypothetical protein